MLGDAGILLASPLRRITPYAISSHFSAMIDYFLSDAFDAAIDILFVSRFHAAAMPDSFHCATFSFFITFLSPFFRLRTSPRPHHARFLRRHDIDTGYFFSFQPFLRLSADYAASHDFAYFIFNMIFQH